MKKKTLWAKIMSITLVAALFCGVAASAYFESPIPEYYDGSYGKTYKVTSILYEDNSTTFRGSVWAQTNDSSNVPADTIGCLAMLCDGEDGEAFYTGKWSYNTSQTYFHYVVTSKQHYTRSVFAKGLVDVGTGDYELAPESPARGSARSISALMHTLTKDNTYPVNEQGETYGSMLLANVVNEVPDLISAKSANGISGYIRADDLRPAKIGKASPATCSDEPDTIPLYDLNGAVIGSFEIGENEEMDINATDIEAAKASVETALSNDSIVAKSIGGIKASLETAPEKAFSTNVTTSADVVKSRVAERNLVNGQYPTTADGKTYGPIGIIPHVHPDLVSVIATNGERGYAKFEEFDPFLALLTNPNTTPEELAYAKAHLDDYSDNLIPVYDLNGNVVGQFLSNASDGSDANRMN